VSTFLNRLRQLSWSKLYNRLVPGWQHLFRSRLRTCRCCERLSLVEVRDPRGERQRCLRCGANLRYELLATAIRQAGPLAGRTVMELDYRSPLTALLTSAGTYHRTYYAENEARGTVRADGARCEDVTALTLPDASVDLLVSSEVLEHVPDLDAAAREITRVLRPGGRHLFTVPTVDAGPTVQRAKIEGGKLVHLATPEYHGDSTTGGGILAFWTYGRDLPERMDRHGLKTEVCLEERDARGGLRRLVWSSRKPLAS
jgi:SAM-dependent methyltransferase